MQLPTAEEAAVDETALKTGAAHTSRTTTPVHILYNKVVLAQENGARTKENVNVEHQGNDRKEVKKIWRGAPETVRKEVDGTASRQLSATWDRGWLTSPREASGAADSGARS